MKKSLIGECDTELEEDMRIFLLKNEIFIS